MPLDPRLRGLLVCPSCRGGLLERPDALICAAEAILWPIVDGVPHLAPELGIRVGSAAGQADAGSGEHDGVPGAGPPRRE